MVLRHARRARNGSPRGRESRRRGNNSNAAHRRSSDRQALVRLFAASGKEPAERRHRHRARSRGDDQPHQSRRATAAGAENGGGRPAHRRHRARLQQHACRRHRRPQSVATPACARRHQCQPLYRCGHGGRDARGGLDPAAACLFAAATAGARTGRRQQHGLRHDGAC